jgi:hypothetical protein
MFTWKKLGRIFHPQSIEDRPWLKEFAQAPAVLKFDTFIRVYFSCRPAADENGQYVSYSSFVDLDRSDITKVSAIADQPILELGKRGCFDEFGTYPVSIIRHNDEVRAYYAGWTRCASVPFNVAIGYAVSRDNGVTFQKTGPGPGVSYSIDEPFVISGPKIRRYNDLWYLWYIAGKKWIPNSGRPEPVYRIRMATSVNGIDWVKANKDLVPCRLEENECQASPDVFFHNGRYHMFYCYRYSLNYRGKEGGYRIGYAWSDDLVHWTRDDDKAGIDISGEGWDSEMISYPHVFELDGSIYMFYLGNQVGRHGFGAAKLEGEL